MARMMPRASLRSYASVSEALVIEAGQRASRSRVVEDLRRLAVGVGGELVCVAAAFRVRHVGIAGFDVTDILGKEDLADGGRILDFDGEGRQERGVLKWFRGAQRRDIGARRAQTLRAMAALTMRLMSEVSTTKALMFGDPRWIETARCGLEARGEARRTSGAVRACAAASTAVTSAQA